MYLIDDAFFFFLFFPFFFLFLLPPTLVLGRRLLVYFGKRIYWFVVYTSGVLVLSLFFFGFLDRLAGRNRCKLTVDWNHARGFMILFVGGLPLFFNFFLLHSAVFLFLSRVPIPSQSVCCYIISWLWISI